MLASLGTIQFVSNVCFAHFVLRERVTRRVLLATACIVGGCITLVLFGNHESADFGVEDMMRLYARTTYVSRPARPPPTRRQSLPRNQTPRRSMFPPGLAPHPRLVLCFLPWLRRGAHWRIRLRRVMHQSVLCLELPRMLRYVSSVDAHAVMPPSL